MSYPIGVPLNQQNIGQTIRQPSTANFLISSKDRQDFSTTGGNPADFTINKNSNLLNGFFTRIAPTEVVLDWCIDNVSPYWRNSLIYVQIPAGPQLSYLVPAGQYTVATLLDLIVAGLSNATYTFSLVATLDGLKAIQCALAAAPTVPINFQFKSTSNSGIDVSALPTQLNLKLNTTGTNFPVDCPKLLPTQYIDFVSQTLTNNQSLRDASTSLTEQNILFRWYFAWDSPEPLDTYGYPIYQGYKRFIQRREIAFPKQIAWVPNQPIGQLSFQVYDDGGNILDSSLAAGEMEWFMTALVSEN